MLVLSTVALTVAVVGVADSAKEQSLVVSRWNNTTMRVISFLVYCA
jgi:hypothetical protein